MLYFNRKFANNTHKSCIRATVGGRGCLGGGGEGRGVQGGGELGVRQKPLSCGSAFLRAKKWPAKTLRTCIPAKFVISARFSPLFRITLDPFCTTGQLLIRKDCIWRNFRLSHAQNWLLFYDCIVLDALFKLFN